MARPTTLQNPWLPLAIKLGGPAGRVFRITKNTYARTASQAWAAWETTSPFEAVYGKTLTEVNAKLVALTEARLSK